MSGQGSLVASLTDVQILTLTLFGESRGEPIEGQIAVACLIRNRKDTGRWGGSYASVCLAPWQFSCWKKEGGLHNYELVLSMAKNLATSTQMPEDMTLRQCAWIAQGVIGNWIKDTVRGATHYYAPKAMKPVGSVPNWAINQVPVLTLGNHKFYREIR